MELVIETMTLEEFEQALETEPYAPRGELIPFIDRLEKERRLFVRGMTDRQRARLIMYYVKKDTSIHFKNQRDGRWLVYLAPRNRTRDEPVVLTKARSAPLNRPED